MRHRGLDAVEDATAHEGESSSADVQQRARSTLGAQEDPLFREGSLLRARAKDTGGIGKIASEIGCLENLSDSHINCSMPQV